MYLIVAYSNRSCTGFHDLCTTFDVRGSVHHNIIHIKKIQRDATMYKNLFHIYMKLNMFRATHRPSSGA